MNDNDRDGATFRMEQQVVLITGAGRGLGAAYARLFGELGATVVVHDAGVEADGSGADQSVAAGVVAEILERGGAAGPATANLLERGACEALVADAIARHGRLDALVHNAGVVLWEDVDYPSDAIWDQTMGVNADAGFRLVRAALGQMRSQRYGRIVLTISGRATRIENAAPGLVAYSAAKMAVYGLMVGFKANVPDDDIHINAISPAAATRVLVRDAPHLTVESVAPGAVLLASSAISSSGNVLSASGGQFRLDQWQEGASLDLGPHPTVSDLLGAWDQLSGGR